jgi:hypothetical protein
LMSALVLESVGTQEYSVNPESFAKRLAESYGEPAAEQVLPHLLAGAPPKIGASELSAGSLDRVSRKTPGLGSGEDSH